MRAFILFSLLIFAVEAFSQTEVVQKEKGTVQIEVGYFGDFFYTNISGPQMEKLSGITLPSWAPSGITESSQGTSASINAGYYTAAFQKPIKSGGKLWWSAGISYLHRNITECFYSTDSITSDIVQVSGQDSLHIYKKESQMGTSAIQGSQINFPIGVRFISHEKYKRRLQAGVNLAPGFTFTHEYWESSGVITSTAIADPGGPENSLFRQTEQVQGYDHLETKKIKGNYFTFYAGLPVNICFPEKRWQFLLSFEPGYTLTALQDVTVKGNFMLRLGLGVKYVL